MLLNETLELHPYQPADMSDNATFWVCLTVAFVALVTASIVLIAKKYDSPVGSVLLILSLFAAAVSSVNGVNAVNGELPGQLEERKQEAISVAEQMGMDVEDMKRVVVYGKNLGRDSPPLFAEKADGNVVLIDPILSRDCTPTGGCYYTVEGYKFQTLDMTLEEHKMPYLTPSDLYEHRVSH